MMIVYGFLNPSTIFWIYLILSIIWSVHWNEQVFKKKNKLKNASDFYCLMMTVNLLSIKNTEFYTVIGQIDQKFSKTKSTSEILEFESLERSIRVESEAAVVFRPFFFELPKFGFGIIRAIWHFKEFWRVFESKKIIKSCNVSERWSNTKNVPKNCTNRTLC